MAGFVFNRGALYLQNGTLDWVTADIRARLSRTSETVNLDSDVMTGLGLADTDTLVTGCVGPTLDDVNDRVVYTSDGFSFVNVAEGAQVDKVVVYAFGTSDADSVPIALMLINPMIPNGGSLGINIPAAGLFYTQQ